MATQRSSSLAHLFAFPLLIVPFTLYNMIAFLLNLEFSTTVGSISLLSGQSLPVSAGDILVLLGVFLLYFEILKSTRMSIREMMDHVLSLVLFFAMTFEFLTVQRAANSSFLLLLALSLVDVIGGFTITIRTTQREISIDPPGHAV